MQNFYQTPSIKSTTQISLEKAQKLSFKALLNRSNISSNITKMPFWMKCCIGLTERKNSKKRKNHAR